VLKKQINNFFKEDYSLKNEFDHTYKHLIAAMRNLVKHLVSHDSYTIYINNKQQIELKGRYIQYLTDCGQKKIFIMLDYTINTEYFSIRKESVSVHRHKYGTSCVSFICNGIAMIFEYKKNKKLNNENDINNKENYRIIKLGTLFGEKAQILFES
jgi:hypothetical protein